MTVHKNAVTIEGISAPNIGIEGVQTVRAEGLTIPPLAIRLLADCEKAIESLVF